MARHSVSTRLVVFAVALAAAVAACNSPTDYVAFSGQALTGQWSTANVQFMASDAGATISVPCISAAFPPIVLDDTLGFNIVGSVAAAAGAVTVKVGDPYVLAGHVSGQQLVLNDPTVGQVTLALGSPDTALVCNR